MQKLTSSHGHIAHYFLFSFLMIQPYVKEASHFVTGVICSHAVLHGKLHVFETEQKTKSTLVMKNMLAESVLAVVGLLCRI